MSLGSLNPKSAGLNVWAVFSGVVTVLSVPSGALLTGVTLIVIVLGVGIEYPRRRWPCHRCPAPGT